MHLDGIPCHWVGVGLPEGRFNFSEGNYEAKAALLWATSALLDLPYGNIALDDLMYSARCRLIRLVAILSMISISVSGIWIASPLNACLIFQTDQSLPI